MLQDTTVIWYATDARALSFVNLSVYDHRGRWLLADGKLEFECDGGGFKIDAGKIRQVELVAQNPSWVWQIVGALVFCYVMFERTGSLATAVVLASGVLAAGIAVTFAIQWVRITYERKDGRLERAWFADGSYLGWAAVWGRTSRLYDLVLDLVEDPKSLAAQSDAAAPMAVGSPPLSRQAPTEIECPWCEERVIARDGMCPACDRPVD